MLDGALIVCGATKKSRVVHQDFKITHRLVG